MTGTDTVVEVLGTEQHACWAERVLPPVEQLAGWLWSVPVPIPDNPLRYTSSYVLLGDDGPVVVDPGWDSPDGWTALTAGLAAAGTTAGEVAGIVVTHVHADHHGLSWRLREQSGAWVAMHPAERDTLPQRTRTADPTERRRAVERWLARSGAPAADAAELLAPLRGDQDPGGMAEPDVLLDDGDLVPVRGRTVRALWTPGHTPGHLCLRDEDARLLLTGDHVLPRITPNIGLAPETERPALADFLTSLRRVAAFDDHDVLPAHEWRFRGLAARTAQLVEHHERRCAELLGVVAELGAPTIWALAEHLTWSRPWSEVGAMRFGAIAETAAHVGYLESLGQVTRSRGEDGATVVRLA
ncbi:MBL fold metallo-hydrolase [Actinomycetospora sp. TBRC 11914]|uniref:MBL fold metallo-hydrolase n=1 Tax=Actinomycetospora sp. TBRC 11914 TaxID=2729387 RepID=UPI00145D8C2B|nr:MBL fold metallo-hydrolase [Actinomycetospora sp. TBRC 11914]NMO93548.1 MBL fold metallo-hydrolase [Actinomycetospora sp. TBRC 11914]